jgi:putative endonuclease
MTFSRSETGRWAEDKAVDFLKSRGYHILQTNFRSHVGEIDVIAQHEDCLCFVEVKFRHDLSRGHPFESVPAYKQNKIIRTAKQYMQQLDDPSIQPRFDVVGLWMDDQELRIEVIQDAFDEC